MSHYLPCPMSLLVMLVLVPVTTRGPAVGAEKKSIKFVEEWEKVPPSEARIPNLNKAQLLVESTRPPRQARNSLHGKLAIRSFRGTAADRASRAVQLVWSGGKWLYQRRRRL